MRTRNARLQASAACAEPLESRRLLAAPTLSMITPISVASDATETALTYEQLAAAADEFDADGDTLVFNLHGVAQEFIRNGVPDPSGFVTLQPGGGAAGSVVVDLVSPLGGDYPPIIVTVTDGVDESPQVLLWFVRLPPANRPPQSIEASPMQLAVVRGQGQPVAAYQFRQFAADPDGDLFAIRIESDPYALLPDGYVLGQTLISDMGDGPGAVFSGAVASVTLRTAAMPTGTYDAFSAVAVDMHGHVSSPFAIALDVAVAPTFRNGRIPRFGPVAPGGSLVIRYDEIASLSGAAADGGAVPEMRIEDLSPRTGGSVVPPFEQPHSTLSMGGVEVAPAFTLLPGQSVVWTVPAGFGGFSPDLMRITLVDRHASASETFTVGARVLVDTGLGGPYTAPIGRRMSAAYDPATGELDAAMRNDLDHVVLFGQSDGDATWLRLDFTTDLGLGTVRSDPVIWNDPRDGQGYGAAITDAGLVLLTADQEGDLVVRNLAAEIPGAPVLQGELTAFIGRSNRVYIAGRTAAGDIVVYSQTGAGHAGAWAWTAENLYDTQLRARGLATPALVGPIISYVTEWDALTIAGLTADGDIWGVWTAPGADGWSSTNLSRVTGALPLAGGLTAFLTSWGGINLAGIDRQGHMSVAWWVPGFGGEWRHTDFTESYGGTALRPETISSFVAPWGALNIAGMDSAGQLQVYWWEPTRSGDAQRDRWDFTPLTPQPGPGGGAPPPSIALTSRLTTLVTADNRMNIFGLGLSGEAVRVWWQPDFGGQWKGEAL